MSNRVVVTGATGTIGQRVVDGLLAKGVSVTALVRDASRSSALGEKGARLAPGSFEDAASLRAAFESADTVVLITAANAKADTQTIAAISAAREARVRKIVRISALKAAVDGPTDNTRQHGRTEAALRESGLTYVILRPHFFMQNLLGSAASVTGEGKLYFGTGTGRLGMIDTRDVADAAVVAATSSAFDGKTLELTGPASLDYGAVAAALGKALSRDVTYVAVPPEAIAQAVRGMGADEWTAGIMRDYCAAYAAGFGDFTTDEVRNVTGSAPRSLDDFIREVFVPAVRASA